MTLTDEQLAAERRRAEVFESFATKAESDLAACREKAEADRQDAERWRALQDEIIVVDTSDRTGRINITLALVCDRVWIHATNSKAWPFSAVMDEKVAKRAIDAALTVRPPSPAAEGEGKS